MFRTRGWRSCWGFMVGGAALTLQVVPTTAQAVSFNVDFGGGGVPDSSYGAAVGQPGHWNLVAGTNTALCDFNGFSTEITLTISGFQTINNTAGGGTDFGALMKSGAKRGFGTTNPWTVSIGSLASGLYRVTIYDQVQEAFSPGDFTVEGTSVGDFNGPSEATGFLNGQNYRSVDVNVTDGTLNLAQVSGASPPVGTSYGIAGLQITANPVPEPGTMALAGLALAAAARRHRTARRI